MRLLLLNLLLYLPGAHAWAAPVDDAVARARGQNLAAERRWRLLGHYARTRLGFIRSEAKGEDFFLAPGGRRDPAAELEATLRAFFAPVADLDAHARCRFPARWEWLDKRLALAAALPEPNCPALDAWRAKVAPAGVTMVFASAYMNNPGSAYGHTFLRLDKEGGGTPLLNHALNFAAMIDNPNAFAYALKGLAGLFPGRYTAMPYYMKVQEYSNLEDRDLWEYEIRLSSAARARLVDHAWELGQAWFPYYFFNKNCSYQLLPLLEAAEPSLRLTPHQALWIIPIDTVRRLQRAGGLVGPAVYRPSRSSVLRMRRAGLSPEEDALAHAVAAGDAASAFAAARRLEPAREAAVLDTAAEYLLYVGGPKTDPGADIEARERPLLLRRGKLEAAVAPLGIPSWAEPPDQGHASARLGLGLGANQERSFQELQLRPGLHDPLDPPFGHVPHAQLGMMSVRLRRDNDGGGVFIDQFHFLASHSAAPYDRWLKPTAWRLRLGAETADELDKPARRALYARLRGGGGLAFETTAWRRESFFAFAEADLGSGAGLREGYRLGAGGSAGVSVEAASWWRLSLEGEIFGYAAGDTRMVPAALLQSAWDWRRRLQLRAVLRAERRRREISGALLIYL